MLRAVSTFPKGKNRRLNKTCLELVNKARRLGPRLVRRFRHDRRRRSQDGPAVDHGRAGRTLPHPYHSPDKKVIDGEDPGGITKALAGKAAAGSAINGWPPRFWKRTSGATGSSARISMPPCWPKRCASWKGSPMRPVTPSIGSRALDRAGLHLRHDPEPQPRTAPAVERGGGVGALAARYVLCIPGKGRPLPNLTVKKIPRQFFPAASGATTTTA